MGNLNKLEILNVSHNKLANIPHQFYKLTELCELYWKNNGLRELDSAIGDLVMLSHLVNYNKTCTCIKIVSCTSIF